MKERINREMAGYGLGYVGQSLSYTLVTAYFSFFMTTCVGIRATQAGTIMSVALSAPPGWGGGAPLCWPPPSFFPC